MIISYRTPAGSGGYVTLADDANSTGTQDSISQFWPQLTKQPQTEQLALSPQSFVADRGNSLWSLSFTVDRLHATAAAAMLYLLQQGAVFSGQPPVSFDLQINQQGQVFYAPGCALSKFTPDPTSDQSTRVKYEFVCPNITTTPP